MSCEARVSPAGLSPELEAELLGEANAKPGLRPRAEDPEDQARFP